jgi:hypothetical protein
VAFFLIGVSFVAYLALPMYQGGGKGFRPMVERMNGLDPDRKVRTLVYKEFLPSISFYRRELAVMAMGRVREVDFEKDEAYRQWYVRTGEELRAAVSGRPRLFVVCEPNHVGEFTRITNFACTEILSQKRFTAYDCRPAGPVPDQPLPPVSPPAPEE